MGAFGPEALKAMGEAFDQTWAEIAGNFGDSPMQIEGARLRLADAVLCAAAEGSTDVAVIKADALHVMLVGYRWRIRPAA
jgi:hypothetical protein